MAIMPGSSKDLELGKISSAPAPSTTVEVGEYGPPAKGAIPAIAARDADETSPRCRRTGQTMVAFPVGLLLYGRSLEKLYH